MSQADNDDNNNISDDCQRGRPKYQNLIDTISEHIIDINDTPDIATWNKKLHIEENASAVNANGLNDAEKIRSSRIIGIGLRDKKALKKDLIVDPANRKEMEEATKSGFTLTDEASDLSP